MELVDFHRQALDATSRRIAAVGDDQWSLPTPCDDWDVRALVNHVVAGNLWTTELAAGATIEDVGDRFDGDLLGADPLAAYRESAERADEVFRRPGALEAMCAVSYGPVPGEVYLGHRCTDVLIHGWDVAEATGGDTALEPELVEACWSVVEPQAHLLAGSGAFATDVEVPPDADLQTRLLSTLGRRSRGS